MISQKKLTELVEKSLEDYLNIVRIENNSKSILANLVDIIYWIKIQPVYGFFSSAALVNLSDRVFQDTIFLNMVLNCTARLNMSLFLQGPDVWDELLETIVNTIASLPKPGNADYRDAVVVMPRDMHAGLYIDPVTLTEFMKFNRWAVWVFLVLLYADIPSPIIPDK